MSIDPQKAYQIRNLKQSKMAHSTEAIEQRLGHQERHNFGFNLPEIILGGQDGLVNVLGIILGVAAATASNHIVIVAGMAATFAESISMAAVAYTTKIAEVDHCQSEYEREKWEIRNHPEGEKEEIRVLYKNFGFSGKLLKEIVETITADQKTWLKIMMEQELNLEEVERKQAVPAAVIVGISAIVGSFIPLVPFLLLPIKMAMIISLVISSLALFFVGYYKAKKTLGRSLFKQGMEMMIIGMVSAFVGYFIGLLLKAPNI